MKKKTHPTRASTTSGAWQELSFHFPSQQQTHDTEVKGKKKSKQKKKLIKIKLSYDHFIKFPSAYFIEIKINNIYNHTLTMTILWLGKNMRK